MRCVFCRAYRSKPGHRLLSAGCTLLSTVRAQSALRAGAVAHGHYYSTRRARVCQGGFTNFSQKNGGEGGVLPSPSFLPPIPLSPHPPSPAGKGENQSFLMQGASPLASPALNRLRHSQSLPSRCPAGACLVCRLPTLPLACFSAPIPPAPFPAGRGRFLVYFAGGFAPGTPAPEPKRAPEQGSEPRARRGLVPGGVGRGEKPGNEHKCRFRETIKNRGKFWGFGGLFQESPGVSLPRSQPVPFPGSNRIIEESSGGSGGLFQESPGVSPPPRASPLSAKDVNPVCGV